jgi:hypothetical protein
MLAAVQFVFTVAQYVAHEPGWPESPPASPLVPDEPLVPLVPDVPEVPDDVPELPDVPLVPLEAPDVPEVPDEVPLVPLLLLLLVLLPLLSLLHPPLAAPTKTSTAPPKQRPRIIMASPPYRGPPRTAEVCRLARSADSRCFCAVSSSESTPRKFSSCRAWA